ncbi:MAG: alanine--tRNA ligase [Planctomycetes bacterium]|nr:alanine--tRNA ligase [Planctomycetota bacterium]
MSPATQPTPSLRVPAAAVRAQFVQFFEQRGHTFVPSSPVFPQDDPTLLFTNAGMNQFKDVFLGTGKRPYKRAVNSQKCIRVSGKHNDLEEVGVDHYHHTFFEMLGNWSFGDYFKRDAIAWSWQLLTEVYGLPKDRLWVTVFGGDEKDGLPADEEAARIWRELTDVDPRRILRFGRKANFWEMGDTGPCGPCTEIHFDTGGPGTDPADGFDAVKGVNGPNARFLELWNNVFMEFNRQDDGKLVVLPSQHVDTGMGLERIARVLNGKASNYDTDLFEPLFRATESRSGRRYGGGEGRADVAFRVIADHARAVSIAFADGALPSNTGRGYVLRRLIRRAARYGRQELGLEDPFLCELVPSVAAILGDAFPEVRTRVEHVALLVREEELSFGRTLGRGLLRFGELENKVAKAKSRTLPGAEAFDLYATYGFPQDLIELMAREKGLELDAAAFAAAEKAHQDASRSEGKFKQLLSAEQLAGLPPTRSTYHETGESAARLATRILRSGRMLDDSESWVVLDASPFYAEGGGQVGDVGVLRSVQGQVVFEVTSTRRIGALVVHFGPHAAPAQDVMAEVDTAKRDATRKNHTATHFLHKALRDVLGAHVTQQGSYVGPDRLRFDFSHPKAVTNEQLEEIERRVMRAVIANAALLTTIEDLEAAKARGVMALFGEKYDAQVRVVACGDSIELCGGTHVRASGDIGPFVITQERAVQAGVRRIEAVTGLEAHALIQKRKQWLESAARALQAPAEKLEERIGQLQEQLKEARKKGAAGAKADQATLLAKLRAALSERGGVQFGVLDLPDADGAAVRELAGAAKGMSKDLALALFGREEGRVPFVILCEGAALAKGAKAGVLAQLAASKLGGGGGGRPEMAQGQGLQPEAVPAAVEAVAQRLSELLS